MLKRLFILLPLLLSFSLWGQTEVTLEVTNDVNVINGKEDCLVRNQTIQNMTNSNPLYTYFIDDERDGIISLHPFILEDIGGWTTFINAVKSDPNITFRYTGSHASRLFDGYYHRYQQLYKGIEVVDGGFTIFTDTEDIEAIPGPCDNCPPPVDRCDEVHTFAPYIYEGIDSHGSPQIWVYTYWDKAGRFVESQKVFKIN